jgi:hypothetical protein
MRATLTLHCSAEGCENNTSMKIREDEIGLFGDGSGWTDGTFSRPDGWTMLRVAFREAIYCPEHAVEVPS